MTQKISVQSMAYESVAADISSYFEAQPSPFDSYYESHILKSEYFHLTMNGEVAALVGVFEKQLMTLFLVKPVYRRYGQQLFQEAKRLREVFNAYVVTSDELYLSHALEVAKETHLQAYFFKQEGMENQPLPADEGFDISVATATDYDRLIADTTDFFDEPNTQIENGEIYICRMNGKVVSYGIIEQSKIYNALASIGMIVVEGERQKGYGTMTLRALRKRCIGQNITPIAGCWYFNHQSKKTIEASGFYSQTRLLRIVF